MNYENEREAVAATMRRLYDRGLTTCSGGNISLRLGNNLVAITPSAIDKAYIKAEQVAIIQMDGKNLTPELKCSIETGMHLEVLKARPDINAIVHAHPTKASFFTCYSELNINTKLLAEARLLLGDIKKAPYAIMGSPQLAKNVSITLGTKDMAVLMENHGVMTLGKTLLKAYDRIEVLEAAAEMTLLAQNIGGIRSLSSEQCKEIDNFRS